MSKEYPNPLFDEIDRLKADNKELTSLLCKSAFYIALVAGEKNKYSNEALELLQDIYAKTKAEEK